MMRRKKRSLIYIGWGMGNRFHWEMVAFRCVCTHAFSLMIDAGVICISRHAQTANCHRLYSTLHYIIRHFSIGWDCHRLQPAFRAQSDRRWRTKQQHFFSPVEQKKASATNKQQKLLTFSENEARAAKGPFEWLSATADLIVESCVVEFRSCRICGEQEVRDEEAKE